MVKRGFGYYLFQLSRACGNGWRRHCNNEIIQTGGGKFSRPVFILGCKMILPVAADIRSYMEGYGISASIISDAWINAEITNFVVPYVERYARTKLMTLATATEWYSGNGSS